jgi:uncharacterized protein
MFYEDGEGHMTTREAAEDFLSQQKLAVVGASNDRDKFGNQVYRTLKRHDYHVIPVNPNVDTVEGDKAYPDLKSLPQEVGGAVIVVPPAVTEKVVGDALAAGIMRVWMQPGAESQEAIKFCEENGIAAVYESCIMMYVKEIGFPHNVHSWFAQTQGRLTELEPGGRD